MTPVCRICGLWRIRRVATWRGLWNDGKPFLMCDDCKSSGAGRGNGSVPVPINPER